MLKEFKEFAFKGNLLDLAVALVLGLAFTALVQSFVDNLIMPIVGAIFTDESLAAKAVTIGGVQLTWGAFVSALVYFIIVAFVLFLIVKAFNKMKKAEAATTRDCPYCLSAIPLAATKCAHCGSEVPAV